MKRTTVCLILILCAFAVAQGQTTAAAIPPGRLVEKVVCAKVPTQSYAAYLPSSYTAARSWPILYAFDPGARGTLPVTRYQQAAEKYGWIVIGSNNSQNGSMQQSLDAWVAMW